MISKPRGTRDFLPDEKEERVRTYGALRETARLFGYREVETPTFELAELFIARSGPEVVDQMYTFEDRGGRLLALRPELTAPVARMYSAEMRSIPKPLKLFYFGNCYRYERPQKGRYREFAQFGAELIGTDSPAANADLIGLAVQNLAAVGLDDYVLRVGDLRVLKALLGDDATPEVMRLIDKKDPALRGVLPDRADAILDPRIDDVRGMAGPDVMAGFDELAGHLDAMGVSFEFDVGIARGLDYYSGIVFEADAPSLGAEKQVCGGGSYDLGGVVGIEGLRATGFAMGIDRLIMASGGTEERTQVANVYIAALDDTAIPVALSAARSLRRAGISTDVALAPTRPNKAIKAALDRGASTVIFIGEDELASNTAAVKDLSSKEQTTVPMDDLVEHLS